MRKIRIIIGMLVWAALVAGSWYGVQHVTQNYRDATSELADFALGKRARLAADGPCLASVNNGDPIFIISADGKPSHVGEMLVVDGDDSQRNATAVFYANSPNVSFDQELIYYRTPDSLEWVLQTMLPKQRRDEVIVEMQSAFQAHHQEILDALRPIVEDSLREGLPLVEKDLRASLVKHRPELEKLGGKYQRQIVEKELVPLVRKEIWPIVKAHAEPEVSKVGRELWGRVSLWRFGWRFVYDKAPLTQDGKVKEEWKRFVEDDATPILESHIDEFVSVQQSVLKDVAKNEEVQRVVRENLGAIVQDKELQSLVWKIVNESIIENKELKQAMRKQWQSPRAHAAFQLAGERLEPSVRRIGEMIFGTPDGGITPEFARVLRNQILAKDKQWLVLQPTAVPRESATAAPLLIRDGGVPVVNPFVIHSSVNST